jgi:hypothetical protein
VGEPTSVERRRYARVRAPILVRPIGPAALQHLPRQVGDIGVGGLRAYSDDVQTPGTRVELELFLPKGEPAVVLAEVAWVQELPPGGAARFDVGLRFLHVSEADLARIGAALVP